MLGNQRVFPDMQTGLETRASMAPDLQDGIRDAAAGCILITRPEPGASETAVRVSQLGFEPVLAPVLAIELTPVRFPAPERVSAIVTTSGNAVAAFPPPFHALPLLTVGDATAERARAAGFMRVSSAAGDARDLAGLVRQNLEPGNGPLLQACGRGQGQALAATLRALGYRVIRRVVYASAPVSELAPSAVDALRGGRVKSVLFLSAETARQFVRLARRAGVGETVCTADAISIGQPAAVALRTLPWRRIRVAARPNQDEMLALLQ